MRPERRNDGTCWHQADFLRKRNERTGQEVEVNALRRLKNLGNVDRMHYHSRSIQTLRGRTIRSSLGRVFLVRPRLREYVLVL